MFCVDCGCACRCELVGRVSAGDGEQRYLHFSVLFVLRTLAILCEWLQSGEWELRKCKKESNSCLLHCR